MRGYPVERRGVIGEEEMLVAPQVRYGTSNASVFGIARTNEPKLVRASRGVFLTQANEEDILAGVVPYGQRDVPGTRSGGSNAVVTRDADPWATIIRARVHLDPPSRQVGIPTRSRGTTCGEEEAHHEGDDSRNL